MHSSASDLTLLLESDLSQHGWNGSYDPFPGEPARHFAMRSIGQSLTKKFHNFEVNEKADRAALDLFLSINEACGKFHWDPTIRSDLVAVALGEARSFLYDFCYPIRTDHESGESYLDNLLSLVKIYEGFGVGNGANIGSKSTDFYSKLSTSSMAATDSALHMLYVNAISSNVLWRDLEGFRARNMGREVVSGSRLSFVPKTTEISRTICTEPVLNMLFQKGIGYVLTKRMMQTVGIDLRIQPEKNALLARIGSVHGNFGTIDLSSASDSMSVALVETFFPPDVVRWLMRTRCGKTILPDGKTIDLNMVSSMGNAFTFPLQTIFFTALVIGAYRAYDIEIRRPMGRSLGNFAVFGDDIIVDKRAYGLLSEMLGICGFKVNDGKSFNSGLFRESCGHDYYSGYNVRGVYIKSLRDANDCYSAINRLNRWSASHRIPLENTVTYLSKKCRLLPVPFDEQDDSGVKVPRSFLLRPRYDRNGAVMYRRSHVKDAVVKIDSEGRWASHKNLKGFLNPDGLLMSALAGYLRDGRISLRNRVRTAVLRQGCSPCWDNIPASFGENRRFGEDWKFFSLLNLGKVQ